MELQLESHWQPPWLVMPLAMAAQTRRSATLREPMACCAGAGSDARKENRNQRGQFPHDYATIKRVCDVKWVAKARGHD